MAEPKAEDIPLNPESDFFENIAEKLDDKRLAEIAEEVITGFDSDKESLTELEQTRDEYDTLFNLTYQEKNDPWENAANVKLPIITTACTNFWARAGINLFPADNRIVNVLAVDNSPDSIERSKRVKRHMNWQLMTMPDFFDGFSKSLMSLPKDGYAFRKTYWDGNSNKVVSVPVLPQNFIVNYYTKNLKTSMRYSEVLMISVNDIKIKMEQGIYKEHEDITEDSTSNPELDTTTIENKRQLGQDQPSEVDYTTPREVIEQHTYLHIGDDNIRRPFIVTVEKDSRKVLRIVNRTNPVTGDPMEYYTAYSFITNPNSIFGFGFGHLLLGVTAAMNTSMNQIIDAATASNHKGGWILKGSQMNRGDQRFKMGQFKQISVRGDDLRKAILPLEFDPPPQVLLNLIEFLEAFAEKLTTVTDISTGQAPRSDTTATSSTIALEQGQKVFTNIQLQIHRSFKEELKKIFDLNGIFLDQTEYFDVVSEGVPERLAITIDDYIEPLDIIPVSDPNVISDQQIAAKAQFLSEQVLNNPFLAQDPQALKLIMERSLESAQINQGDINLLNKLMDINIKQQDQEKTDELDQNQATLQGEQAQLEEQAQLQGQVQQ